MSYYCRQCQVTRTQGCFAKGCPGIPATAEQDALPALPPPDRVMWQYGRQIDHYTAQQMMDYARSALKISRGEA